MYTELSVTRLKNEIADNRHATVSLNGNYAIPVEGDGNGIIFEVENEAIYEVALKVIAADNVFCGGDHELVFKPNCKSMLRFEGAPYVQNSGEYKGKILVQGGEEGLNAFFTVAEII